VTDQIGLRLILFLAIEKPPSRAVDLYNVTVNAVFVKVMQRMPFWTVNSQGFYWSKNKRIGASCPNPFV
jgi:hypothetical protein